jgi:MinD superfamily P-loop ATPase
MRITIASGKGGTGKTTLAVNLAYAVASAGGAVTLLDCDVEAPNAHLFLQPAFSDSVPVTVPKPVLDGERCTLCGRCASACAFNAIAVIKKKLLIFPELCHACGACTEVCPEAAIREEPHPIGVVRRGSTGPALAEAPFLLADGALNVGESQAPVVVRAVKAQAGARARPGAPPAAREPLVLIDASPGTACPVVEATRDSDVVLLVTEPTPFGLHDLQLAVSLSLQLGIPTGVVINRSVGRDGLIEGYCREAGVPIVGRIPFRRDYAERYSSGDLLARQDPTLARLLLEVLSRARGLLGTAVPPVPAAESWTLMPRPENGAAEAPPATARPHREIGVISGKGGTGKTTVTAALAVLAGDKVLADTDVDAADLHLVLRPVTFEASPFSGGRIFRIDPQRCTGCGLCASRCHFEAIHPEPRDVRTRLGVRGLAGDADRGSPEGQAADEEAPGLAYRIDPVACEACGLCRQVCPESAVSAEDASTGMTFVSATPYGTMVHARLGVGEENSGKLVAEVRRRAAAIAGRGGTPLLLADGPPGVGCPVISSITDLDRVLVVTEPTVSGVHDLQRVLRLAGHFGVPARVVINKADLNPELSGRIEAIAGEAGARVLGTVPFDDRVFEALMLGKTVVEYGEGPAESALRRICVSVLEDLARSG